MIKLKINNHTYAVPSKWEECDAPTFVRLSKAMWNFENGHTDFETFKIEIVAACLGIDIPSTRLTDFLGVNFFTLSGLLTFPYRLVANSDGSETAYIDIEMKRNLFPSADGYRYETDKAGVIDCTLTAAQYTA